MKTVRCAYPVSPIGKGVSGAWKVMGDDGRHYLVKFHTKGDRTALNEILCGHLAPLFNLPTLEPVLITMDAGPAAQISRERAKGRLGPVEQGIHFGVRFSEPFLTVESLADVGEHLTTEQMDNLDAVPSMLGFDTMVQNHDRPCDNTAVEPNVLGTGYSYRVFDFGHALGGPGWTADGIKNTYEILDSLRTSCLAAAHIAAPDDFERSLLAFESHLEQWMEELVDSLPPELGLDAQVDASHLKAALVSLKRCALEEAILGARALEE